MSDALDMNVDEEEVRGMIDTLSDWCPAVRFEYFQTLDPVKTDRYMSSYWNREDDAYSHIRRWVVYAKWGASPPGVFRVADKKHDRYHMDVDFQVTIAHDVYDDDADLFRVQIIRPYTLETMFTSDRWDTIVDTLHTVIAVDAVSNQWDPRTGERY